MFRFKIAVLLFLVFSVNSVTNSVPLWGDDGVEVGRWQYDWDVQSVNWQDNATLYVLRTLHASGRFGIGLQIISENGEAQFAEPIEVFDAANGGLHRNTDFSVFSDQNGGVIILWLQELINDQYMKKMQHYNRNLEAVLWEDGVVLEGMPDVQWVDFRIEAAYFEENRGYQIISLIDVEDNSYLHVNKFDTEVNPLNELPEGTPISTLADIVRVEKTVDNCFWFTLEDPINLEVENAILAINKYDFSRADLIWENPVCLTEDNYNSIRNTAVSTDGTLYVRYRNNARDYGIQRFDNEGAVFDGEGLILDSRSLRGSIFPYSADGADYFYFTKNIGSDEMNVMLYQVEEDGISRLWDSDVEILQSYDRFLLENNCLFSYDINVIEDESIEYENVSCQRINPDGELEFGDNGLFLFEQHIRDWYFSGANVLGFNFKPDGSFRANVTAWKELRIFAFDADCENIWENNFILPFPSGAGRIRAIKPIDESSLGIIYLKTNIVNYNILNRNGQFLFDECRHITSLDSDMYHLALFTSSGQNVGMYYNTRNDGDRALVFNEEMNVFPEQGPLDLGEIYQTLGGDYFLFTMQGDSTGNFWLGLKNRGEDNRIEIIKLDEHCQWLNEEMCIPFPGINCGNRSYILPRNDGGAWVTAFGDNDEVYLNSINRNVVQEWEEPVVLDQLDSEGFPRRIVNNSSGEIMLIKTTEIRPENDIEIYAIKYNGAGETLWEEASELFDPNPGLILSQDGEHYWYEILFDDNGALWLLFRTDTPDIENDIMKLQKISPEGERILGDQGFAIPAPGYPYSEIKLQADGNGGLWMCWMPRFNDNRHSEAKILHLSSEGEVIDEQDEPLGEPALDGVFPSRAGVYDTHLFPDGTLAAIYQIRSDSYLYRAQLFGDPAGVEGQPSQAQMEFSVNRIYPNPFNANALIHYSLNRTAKIKISLFNTLGREVKVLYYGIQTGGNHQIQIGNNDLTSGVYFLRMKAKDRVIHRKVVCLE